MTAKTPRVLSIAGSDSSGGAGIQADIKTITMLGGYAMTAITAVTAQNTRGVDAVSALDPQFVRQQAMACIDDIGVDAIKIGMLASAEQAQTVADLLAALEEEDIPVVFDPVMIATSGAALASEETIALFGKLMDAATVVTPNLPELAALSRQEVDGSEAVVEAALQIAKRHGVVVLAKGGHDEGSAEIIDRVVAPSGKIASFGHARIATRHTHGTGCTLSAALATLLGAGYPLTNAVRHARSFTFRAIENSPGLGSGSGPLGHQAVRRLDQGSKS